VHRFSEHTYAMGAKVGDGSFEVVGLL